MLKLTPSAYRVMPWKNGGGTTTELYLAPAPASLPDAPYLWRASIAEVASDGPFSPFPGCDRHIMCISGPGMILSGGPNGPIDLTTHDTPRSFSGDWPISSKLVAGPVRDFNLIAWRAGVATSLTCLRPSEPFRLDCEAPCHIFLYLISGELAANGQRFSAGESILLGGEDSLELQPHQSGEAPRLAVCRIGPIQPQAGS